MKLYRVFNPNTSLPTYHGTKAGAHADASEIADELGRWDEVQVERLNLPKKKAAILQWLNDVVDCEGEIVETIKGRNAFA